MKRFVSMTIGAGVVSILVAATAVTKTVDPVPLTVHEWGTFTSIAAEDGTAVTWYPQAGPQDLPCFVRRTRFNLKGSLSGTVRMETPVLYFYGRENATVNVRVRFKQGLITEWFPHAGVSPSAPNGFPERGAWDGSITWEGVKVLPGATADFPTESGPSHYYAARHTDAAPLRKGTETEKFLFYRGVGRFAPPIRAAVSASGEIEVSAPGSDPVGDVILFENYRGETAYQVIRGAASAFSLSLPTAKADLASLGRELERILVDQGLYPREASAMVETWRDSWFEEGTRLFYIAPRTAVDAILPLTITPPPADVARVFVGRVELMTPRTLDTVRQAALRNDRATFAKHGRFLAPITQRVVAASAPEERPLVQQRLQDAFDSYFASRPSVAACK